MDTYPKRISFSRRELRLFECNISYTIEVPDKESHRELSFRLENGNEIDTVHGELNFISPLMDSAFVRTMEKPESEIPEVSKAFDDNDIISFIAHKLTIDWLREPGYTEAMFIHTERFKEKYNEIRLKIQEYVQEFVK